MRLTPHPNRFNEARADLLSRICTRVDRPSGQVARADTASRIRKSDVELGCDAAGLDLDPQIYLAARSGEITQLSFY